MRLVVGLRNPGTRYEGTRHNVGGEVAETLVSRSGGTFKRAPGRIAAVVAETRLEAVRVVVAMPRTFMNESGRAVAPLLRYYGVDPDRLLVVHDDIDLPFAKLRVRYGGSTGGHNGVDSVVRSLGTSDFWRLKVGVGRPPGRMDPADFVLSRFRGTERAEMDLVVPDAADVVAAFVTAGGEEARRRAGEVNRRREEQA